MIFSVTGDNYKENNFAILQKEKDYQLLTTDNPYDFSMWMQIFNTRQIRDFSLQPASLPRSQPMNLD